MRFSNRIPSWCFPKYSDCEASQSKGLRKNEEENEYNDNDENGERDEEENEEEREGGRG